MNILVALNDVYIFNNLKEKYKDRVYPYDVANIENVIDIIKSKKQSFIIIIKYALEKDFEFKKYIDEVKTINSKNKIIVLITKLDENIKEFLFSNEIYKIIEGNEIDIDLIYKFIDNDENVIYKTIYLDSKKNNLDSKKSIAVYGTKSSGKSFISSIIGESLARKFRKKILIVSLDYKNQCLDILNNI